MISESQLKFFEGKRILVIVPHQDDEINIAGGLIYWWNTIGCEVYLLYTTNGNYRGLGEKRIKEARNSFSILGGNPDNILCLGYTDQPATESEGHLFMSDEPWKDRWENEYTYIPGETKEFCFLMHGVHNRQCRSNFIKDIKEAILYVHADVLYCVDYDSHPDHRATSIAFEYALGEILRSSIEYHPIVFKTFAYCLAYGGKNDFYESPLPATTYIAEKNSLKPLPNPYYQWDERICFALPDMVLNQYLPKNQIWKALKAHKSQAISDRAGSIINSDQVVWTRRTDSLSYDATFICSSGNALPLNDYVLFDSSNFYFGKKEVLLIDKGAWIPDINDECPFLYIKLKKEEVINSVVLYKNTNSSKGINKVKIIFDEKKSIIVSDNRMDFKWIINTNNYSASSIRIEFLDREDVNSGLTEIELYSKANKILLKEVIYSNNRHCFGANLFFIAVDKFLLLSSKSYNSIRRRYLKLRGRY